MEYVYAAMLLHRAGKEINENNLTQVLTAAGINADPVRIKALVASLAEVNIDEAIKTTPAFVTTTSTPTAPAPTPAPAEKPAKEEKKKEEEEKAKEEAALEGLGALFG